MNVLITGGAGFIGSHLADALIARDDHVIVVDDLSTGVARNIAHLIDKKNFRFVCESVRNETTMTPLVDRCDVIFHLAAAVGVKLIVERPVHTIETNIHGTEVILNLANKFRRKILVASSSEVYGKGTKIPFSEDDDTTFGTTRLSRWSYACSKMVDEFLAMAYHAKHGLGTIVCRFFNTVGPRQTGRYGMVMPRFVRWALANEPLQIYGTGRQVRCFCDVSDVTGALIKLMECPDAVGQVVNVGSDEQISIEALADKIIALVGSRSTKQYVSYEEAYGQPIDDMLVRKPDLTRVGRLIGYRPSHTLDQILNRIVDAERAKPSGPAAARG